MPKESPIPPTRARGLANRTHDLSAHSQKMMRVQDKRRNHQIITQNRMHQGLQRLNFLSITRECSLRTHLSDAVQNVRAIRSKDDQVARLSKSQLVPCCPKIALSSTNMRPSASAKLHRVLAYASPRRPRDEDEGKDALVSAPDLAALDWQMAATPAKHCRNIGPWTCKPIPQWKSHLICA